MSYTPKKVMPASARPNPYMSPKKPTTNRMKVWRNFKIEADKLFDAEALKEFREKMGLMRFLTCFKSLTNTKVITLNEDGEPEEEEHIYLKMATTEEQASNICEILSTMGFGCLEVKEIIFK